MAFVSEEIKEEDYEYFNSLNLKDDIGRPRKPHWWAIDRERNYILYDMGGGILEKPVIMGLYLNGKFVEMWTKARNNLNWEIIHIEAAKVLQEELNSDELTEIIKEAFSKYGRGYRCKAKRETLVASVDIQAKILWK